MGSIGRVPILTGHRLFICPFRWVRLTNRRCNIRSAWFFKFRLSWVQRKCSARQPVGNPWLGPVMWCCWQFVIKWMWFFCWGSEWQLKSLLCFFWALRTNLSPQLFFKHPSLSVLGLGSPFQWQKVFLLLTFAHRCPIFLLREISFIFFIWGFLGRTSVKSYLQFILGDCFKSAWFRWQPMGSGTSTWSTCNIFRWNISFWFQSWQSLRLT